MPDITITYQGNTIAEISDSTQKALKTRGKFLTSDIGVTYEKPSGGGEILVASKILSFPNGAVVQDNIISFKSENLWDGSLGTLDEFIDDNGNVTSSAGSITSPFINISNNYLYNWSGTSQSSSSSNHRVHGFDSNGNWIKLIKRQQPSAGSSYNILFFIDDLNITKIKVCCVNGDSNVGIFTSN